MPLADSRMAAPPAARAGWIRWLPAIIWMALIFLGSTDALSARHTSRFLAPLLRWLAPGIHETTIAQVQWAIRKGGHAFEYAVLAGLYLRALRRPAGNGASRGRAGRTAFVAWLLAVAYALSDEWHQSWVASRYGSALDVGVDALGAFAGVWVVSVWSARRGRR